MISLMLFYTPTYSFALVGILVWMILERELPVRLLQIVLAGVGRHAQHLVVLHVLDHGRLFALTILCRRMCKSQHAPFRHSSVENFLSSSVRVFLRMRFRTRHCDAARHNCRHSSLFVRKHLHIRRFRLPDSYLSLKRLQNVFSSDFRSVKDCVNDVVRASCYISQLLAVSEQLLRNSGSSISQSSKCS